MIVLGSLVDVFICDEKGSTSIPQLCSVFKKGLWDTDFCVNIAALRGVQELAAFADDYNNQAFKTFIDPMINVVRRSLLQGNEQTAVLAVEIMHELVETDLKLRSDEAEKLVLFMLQVAETTELLLTTRDLAMNFVQWVLRHKPHAIATSDLILKILSTVGKLVVESDEIDTFDFDEPTASRIATQTVDVLSLNLPSQYIFEPVLSLIKDLVACHNGRELKAAFSLLSVCAEGFHEELKPKLPEGILSLIFSGFSSCSPEVRCAAGLCFGQFVEHLQPEILECHQQAMPLLIEAWNTDNKNANKSMALAIDIFCENLDAEDLANYIDVLIPKFKNCLQDPTVSLDNKSQIVSGLSSLIATVGSKISKELPDILQMMHEFIKHTEKEWMDIRGMAMMCLGAIGKSVDSQEFQKIVTVFFPLAVEGMSLPNSTTLRQQTFYCMKDVVTSLGIDSAPLLPQIIGFIIETLQTESFVAVKGSSEDNIEMESESEDNFDVEELSIRSGLVDEQVAALAALGAICKHSWQHMKPFLEKESHLQEGVDDCLCHYFGPLKEAALEMLPDLVSVYFKLLPCPWGTKWQPGWPTTFCLTEQMEAVMSQLVWPSLWKILTEDTEKTVVRDAFDALTTIIHILGPSSVENNVKRLCMIMNEIFNGTHPCCSDNEENQIPELTFEQDADLYEGLMNCVSEMAKAGGPSFDRIFQESGLARDAARLACHEKSTAFRQLGLGVSASVLMELGPELASKYVPSLRAEAMKSATMDNSQVKRNAIFLLGVFFQIGHNLEEVNSNIISIYNSVLPCIQRGAQAKSEQSKMPIKERDVVDNAIGCISRAIAHMPSNSLPFALFVDTLFTVLPIESDFEESATVLMAFSRLHYDTNPILVEVASPRLYNILKFSLLEFANPKIMEFREMKTDLREKVANMCKNIACQMSSEQLQMLACETESKPMIRALLHDYVAR
eukprot:GHVL01018746.1.p1 GENE.GHVL01018746.1~~GHVL01018746.1.p1  ORF type:complete len:956 (+),score=158.81 GHVL01018746.1:123-2990(+)